MKVAMKLVVMVLEMVVVKVVVMVAVKVGVVGLAMVRIAGVWLNGMVIDLILETRILDVVRSVPLPSWFPRFLVHFFCIYLCFFCMSWLARICSVFLLTQVCRTVVPFFLFL